ncbi:MAG: hypothetical protein ACSHYB_18725 [Roseibacillus sp.]
MLPDFADYLDVFASDERFLVFASSSIVLAVAVMFFLSGAGRTTRMLLLSAAFLMVFSFVVLAPLTAISEVTPTASVNPVSLNFNFGFLALGAGMFLKFRNLPSGKKAKIINKED